MPLRNTPTVILSPEEMHALLARYQQQRSDDNPDENGYELAEVEAELFTELEAIT